MGRMMGIKIVEIYTQATPSTTINEAKKEAIKLSLEMESEVILNHNDTEYIFGFWELLECPTRKARKR